MNTIIMDKQGKNDDVEDKRIMGLIRKICAHGGNAEVKQNKDGSLKVYKVNKEIAG